MYQYIYIYMLYVHVIWFRKYMYVMLLVVITKRFRPNEWEHCTGILIKTNKCNFYNLSWQRGITIELKNLQPYEKLMFISVALMGISYNTDVWRILWLFSNLTQKRMRRGTQWNLNFITGTAFEMVQLVATLVRVGYYFSSGLYGPWTSLFSSMKSKVII